MKFDCAILRMRFPRSSPKWRAGGVAIRQSTRLRDSHCLSAEGRALQHQVWVVLLSSSSPQFMIFVQVMAVWQMWHGCSVQWHLDLVVIAVAVPQLRRVMNKRSSGYASRLLPLRADYNRDEKSAPPDHSCLALMQSEWTVGSDKAYPLHGPPSPE